jgi:endonuclease YncB( thermonuclease family)
MSAPPWPPMPAPFVFNGTIERVVDGDTLVVLADRGMRDYSRWTVRLAGIGARELDEPGGVEAAQMLATMARIGSPCVLATVKPDKYASRVLATVWVPGLDKPKPLDVGASLVYRGYAVPWDGRGAQPKPPWPLVGVDFLRVYAAYRPVGEP